MKNTAVGVMNELPSKARGGSALKGVFESTINAGCRDGSLAYGPSPASGTLTEKNSRSSARRLPMRLLSSTSQTSGLLCTAYSIQ